MTTEERAKECHGQEMSTWSLEERECHHGSSVEDKSEE
jgi:hypothetical protein